MYEQLKEASRGFFEEVWNKGNLDALDKYLSPDFVQHDPAAPGGEVRGTDGMKLYIATFRNAFPDLRFAIDQIVAEGDYVAVRWTAAGTHKGSFMGIEPTGKYGTVTGMVLTRFADGKFAESYVSKDDLGMFQIIGKVPELFPELVPA